MGYSRSSVTGDFVINKNKDLRRKTDLGQPLLGLLGTAKSGGWHGAEVEGRAQGHEVRCHLPPAAALGCLPTSVFLISWKLLFFNFKIQLIFT